MDERNEYLWVDRNLQQEFERLDKQTHYLDEPSRSRLSGLGLGSSARCLEVGPGTGSMTTWMADRGWSVLALDLSDRFFPAIGRPGVELRVGDIRDAEIDGGFDLIFVRYVLHHLPERGQVVEKLAGLLRPGGWLVAEDPVVELMKTLYGTDVLAYFRDLPPRLAEFGIDHNAGAYLPGLFKNAGLSDITADGSFCLAFEGSPGADLLRLAFDLMEETFVPRGTEKTEDFDLRRAQVSAPQFIGTCPVNISCRGRRAGGGDA